MSRSVFGLFAFLLCFPRVSGDEPIRDDLAAIIDEFSPRERG